MDADWKTKAHSLGDALALRAAENPHAPAITYGDETISRREVEERANALSRYLSAIGVRAGELVGIMLPNGPLHHIATFALWKLGASPMPLSSKLPPAELDSIVAIAGPAHIVGSGPRGTDRSHWIDLSGGAWRVQSTAPVTALTPDPWKAITSGGSSGTPKVIVDDKPGTVVPGAPIPLLGMAENDVMLHAGPLYHNAAFCHTNWGLCWGSHIVGMAKFDPATWLALIERHRVTWAYLVPTMMNRIWNLPAEDRLVHDLSSLRVAIHMASVCPDWLKRAWIDWLGATKIWEVYGSTEGVGTALIIGDEWLKHPGSVGKPLSETRVLDDQGQDCSPGTIGELYFRRSDDGVSNYRYVGAESRCTDGWETLGDLGSLDADGYLYIADRRNDMIISGGANIYPAEIEAALEAHHGIAVAAVVGLPHPDFGRAPHAIIELREGAEAPEAADMEAFLAARLARTKLPYTYEFADAPLRDEAGKMRRARLRDAAEARLAAGVVFRRFRAANKAAIDAV